MSTLLKFFFFIVFNMPNFNLFAYYFLNVPFFNMFLFLLFMLYICVYVCLNTVIVDIEYMCITHRIDSTWSIYSDPITIHNSTLRVKSIFLVSFLEDIMCTGIYCMLSQVQPTIFCLHICGLLVLLRRLFRMNIFVSQHLSSVLFHKF